MRWASVSALPVPVASNVVVPDIPVSLVIPGTLTVPPPLTVILLPLNVVRPEKLGDPPLTEIVPPAYDVSCDVEIAELPSRVRLTLDKLVRRLSCTVPPLEACNNEMVHPLASVKLVNAPTFNTLPVPSLSNTTVPVLIVVNPDNVTVPPANASKLVWAW